MVYDEALADRLRALSAGTPGVTERRMFGGLAFLVHGNMAVAAGSEGGLLLRVPPQRRDELLTLPHTDPFVMPGRTMSGWLSVTPAGVAAPDDLARWARIGFEYAASLPPKPADPKSEPPKP